MEASDMNYLEEKQALESMSQNIDILKQEIQSFKFEKTYAKFRKEEHPFGPVFETMKTDDFENKRQMLLVKIQSIDNQLLDKASLYDKTLINLHYVQYQFVQRSEVLKDLLVASQTPDATVQSIYDSMNAKYKNMDTWHKEFSKEFYEEIEKLQSTDENKARIFINSTVSKLSNALLKPGMHNSQNVATWEKECFDNYPDLVKTIKEIKSLQSNVQNLQKALDFLKNQL